MKDCKKSNLWEAVQQDDGYWCIWDNQKNHAICGSMIYESCKLVVDTLNAVHPSSPSPDWAENAADLKKLVGRLHQLCSQEGCDGEPYDEVNDIADQISNILLKHCPSSEKVDKESEKRS